jgi:L-histidine Nalpha-methyltransferase
VSSRNASTIPGRTTITVHLTPDALGTAMRTEVAAGLTATPKELSPKWLYDDRGCELFEQITHLPEYYPTRAERSILQLHADEIVALSGADTLVELGSGTSDKTRLLLDALQDAGALRRFVPFDVAEPTLREAVTALGLRYQDVAIDGVVGDFTEHLDEIPRQGTRMIVFLGGTIGNLHAPERAEFLASLAATMSPGDSLLLGTDLVKDRRRLVAAYDDAAGITAQFDLNVLAVINRELGGDFDLDGFEHVARFDEDGSFIEMRLRSLRAQRARLRELDLVVEFEAGEELRTEISTKFEPATVRAELAAAGLDVARRWTDPDGDFALWLAVR